MISLTLRQLHYFDALARLGHFGRAAEACHVSQPALTVQIQELEAHLGVVLVERGRRGAVLTQAGQVVALRAQNLLRDASDLIAAARLQNRPLSGKLRFGIIPTVAPYLLPRLLPRLAATYPDLELHVRETQTATLLAELAASEIDLVLAALPISHPDIVSLPLFEDRFVLAAPLHAQFEGRIALSDELLSREPLLLLEEGHCFREQAIRYCSLRQANRFSTLGASSFTTILGMVANGLGITLLPEIALEAETRRDDIRILRLGAPEPSRQLGLLWRRASPRTADYEAMADILRKWAEAPARLNSSLNPALRIMASLPQN